MHAKRFLVAILAAGALVAALRRPAQATPPFILYQGRYLSNGSAVTGTVPMYFRLTDGSNLACTASADGTHLFWTSASTNVVMTDGLFSYKVGFEQNGVTPDPSFQAISWSTATYYYIDVCVSGVSLNPKDLVGSSPFSIFSSTSGFATGNLPLTGGGLSGALNMNGNAINSVATPVNPTDAANKSYVDGASGSALLTSANTWQGDNTFNAEVTVSTSLSMGGYNINNLAGPQLPTDAVNKSYVDNSTVTYVTSSQSPYAVQSTDKVIVADATGGSVVINLPSFQSIGRRLTIVRDDAATSNTVTIGITGGGTAAVPGGNPATQTFIDVSCNASATGTPGNVPYQSEEDCSSSVQLVTFGTSQWLMY